MRISIAWNHCRTSRDSGCGRWIGNPRMESSRLVSLLWFYATADCGFTLQRKSVLGSFRCQLAAGTTPLVNMRTAIRNVVLRGPLGRGTSSRTPRWSRRRFSYPVLSAGFQSKSPMCYLNCSWRFPHGSTGQLRKFLNLLMPK